MRKIILSLVMIIGFISLACAQTSSLAKSDNEFAFSLYNCLSSDKGNIFFSPYSLSSALAMTAEGARGQTAKEMWAVLHLNPNNASRKQTSDFIKYMNRSDKLYELSVANALWAEKSYSFKADYLALVKESYSAQVQNLDLMSDPESSRLTINQWVLDKTNDRIKDLLPPGSVSKSTRLILTNAVYFKGKWETPFKKGETRPGAFWITPDKSVQTQMMSFGGFKHFNYTQDDRAQVLELPYKGHELSMLIILPWSKNIEDLQKELNYAQLRQWQESMTSNDPVQVVLPKFKFDAEYQMKEVLKSLGIRLAFSGNADFSGMTDSKDLYIDQVVHKAWIDANEEGTEAAAATAVMMKAASAVAVLPHFKIFNADHPFIFVIKDNKTGHILFMGRVSDPHKKDV